MSALRQKRTLQCILVMFALLTRSNRRSLMVTLAGLEPATSPAPVNKDALSPLELQRRHDLHDRLWRRWGAGIGFYPATTEQGDARPPLPAVALKTS